MIFIYPFSLQGDLAKELAAAVAAAATANALLSMPVFVYSFFFFLLLFVSIFQLFIGFCCWAFVLLPIRFVRLVWYRRMLV